MVTMSVYNCILSLQIIYSVLMLCRGEDTYCKQDELKKCLKGSYDYLKSNSPNKESFLYKSLDHYMDLLDGTEHMNGIHVSALTTIILPLDTIILDVQLHQQMCNKFNNTLDCLRPHIQTCDNEIRDELEGIIHVFKEVCKPHSQNIFNKEDPCILKKEVTAYASQCEVFLNTTAKQFNPPLPCLEMSNISEACQEELKQYPNNLLQNGVVIPIDANGAHVVMRQRVCAAVQKTLTCYKDHVTEKCTAAAGTWEYNLRHELVHVVLLDLDCLNEGGGHAYNDSCFYCDESKCITRDKICDGTHDCTDLTDELARYCYKQRKQRMSPLAILVVVAVVLVVMCVTAACVVKCVKESKYNQRFMSRSGSEEMTDIVTREVNMGRSTPPPTYDGQNANYIYKPVAT